MTSVKDQIIKDITRAIAKKEVIELLKYIIKNETCYQNCSECCGDFQPDGDSCSLYSLAELIVGDHNDSDTKLFIAKALLEKIEESLSEIVEEA